MSLNPIVFVDSDVIISSLLSQGGAAYLLLYETNLKLFISNLSYKESGLVAERLRVSRDQFEDLVSKRFTTINLEGSIVGIKDLYGDYTNDPDDAHIVAGAAAAKANFLITYNLRDYKVDKIKKHFGILCLTPAQFLQYLRSL